jgi:hypothetical protein
MIEDPLGHILVERQFLTLMDCQDSLATAKSENCFLEEILIRKRKFPRKMLLKILENEYFCPAIDLEKTPGDPALLAVIPRRLAARHLLFPVGTDGQAIKVAFFNPTDARICAAISQMANRTVKPMVALRHDLRDTIKRSYDDMERKLAAETRGKNGQAQQAPTDRRPQVGDRPDVLLSFGKAGEQSATALVDKRVDEASKRGATDIHIESQERRRVVQGGGTARECGRIGGVAHQGPRGHGHHGTANATGWTPYHEEGGPVARFADIQHPLAIRRENRHSPVEQVQGAA